MGPHTTMEAPMSTLPNRDPESTTPDVEGAALDAVEGLTALPPDHAESAEEV
jgi:hypothetical protein